MDQSVPMKITTLSHAASRIVVTAALALCASLAIAQPPGEPLAEERASRTIFDTTPPTTGTLTAPALLKQGPIAITHSGASDAGAGLKRLTLWYRQGESQSWQETSHTSDAAEGTFNFVEALGDGSYHFAVVAEDKAGNASPAPTGTGLATTILDGTPPTITLTPAGATVNMVLNAGQAFVDPGASAQDSRQGNLSAQIVVGGSVNINQPGTYTLTYNVSDAAGNAAEQKTRVVQVLENPTRTLTLLSPEAGSIQTSPTPGEGGVYPMGTVVTLGYTPSPTAGLAVASWVGATPAPADINTATVVMDQNRTVGVNLVLESGTVQVTVSPETGSWTVTDSAGGTFPGTGTQQVASVRPGQVRIDFNEMEGYRTPASQTRTLEKNATAAFSATYEAMGAVTVSLPTGLSASTGQTIAVPISVSTGEALANYAITVGFDAAVFTFESVSPGILVGAWGAPTASPGNGTVAISRSGPALTSTAGGTLATVTLRVKDDAEGGETALTVASASLNGGGLPVQASNGSATVSSFDFYWGDVNNDKKADSVDGNLILRYAIGLTRTLPMQDAIGDPKYVGPANVKGSVPESISIQDAHLIYNLSRGRIASFPADLNGDRVGPESEESAKSELTGEIKEITLPAEMTVANGEERTVRTLGALVAEPAVDILVPISVDNATNVFGYLFELQFDPAVLEFRNISKGIIAESWIEPVFLEEEGVLRWAATGADRLSGAGRLCVITFRGRPNIQPITPTELTLTRAELNDNFIITKVEATAGAPSLEGVEPGRGAVDGYSAIALRGANLAEVDTVLLGDVPSPHVSYEPGTGLLRVITPPQSPRVVSITASALGQESTLENAFEYYEPEVHLALEPEESVYVGEFFAVPVSLNSRVEGVSRVSFVLNFDSETFARSTVDPVVVTQAGAQVTEMRSVGQGRLLITVEGGLGSGPLCTVNLVVVSAGINPDTLVYVSDAEAIAQGASKAVSGGSALPGRGRW